ncbi:MAG: ABC transporter substrate-binding protein [Candidatus Acetothermia bacterium]
MKAVGKTGSILLVLSLIALLGIGGVVAEELVEKAQEEGRVIFYANITAVEPIMEDFEEEYGVKAEYTRISSSDYIPTVMTEFQAGKLKADVLQAPMPMMELLKDEGVLGDYVSPRAELYPEWARDPDGVIQQFGIEYVGIIYNTELVDELEVPTSYKELTDPRWKNKLVMPDPATHATTITWLLGVRDYVFDGDEEEWRDWLGGLADNNPYFAKSFGPSPGPIESGEKLIGESMPKYIISKAPAPLGWADVSKSGEPLMGTPRGIAIRKDPEHPNAAKLFIDYWLSEASMEVLANEVGEYVLYEGIYPPIAGIENPEVQPLESLPDWKIDHWASEFEDIFYD